MSVGIILDLIKSAFPYALFICAFIIFQKLYYVAAFNKKRKDLRNKVVLITGPSSGIGEMLAHKFYAEGCKLILASRSLRDLNRVKEDLMCEYNSSNFLEPVVKKLDLTEESSFPNFVKEIIDEHGDIDILINNAGIRCRTNVLEVDEKLHRDVMQINYFSQVTLTNLIAKRMVERGSGHLVFINSMQSVSLTPHRFPYGSSKNALLSYSESLRSELHPHIRVTSILPTTVNTSLSRRPLNSAGLEYNKLDSSTLNGILPLYVAEETLKAVVLQRPFVILARPHEKVYIFSRLLANPVYQYVGNKLGKKKI